MTEQEVQEVLGRLAGGLMDRSGLNIEAHEWHAIAGFLASTPSALGDWRQLIDHETSRPFFRQGVFTPQGLVHCFDCIGQRDKRFRQVTPGDGYNVTYCMKCGVAMVCREDVADLNNLRLALPHGWYPRLEQTGGMTCNLYMDVVTREYMVWVNDDSEVDHKFGVCWYPDSTEDSSNTQHVVYFDTADEAVLAVTNHAFKYGVRVQ